MGKGIYGCNQGDESRAAGRHNGQAMMEERMADNAICEGDVLADWKGYYQLGQWETLNAEVERTTALWLAQKPEGEKESKWRSAVLGRIQSILTRATFGASAAKEGSAATRRRRNRR